MTTTDTPRTDAIEHRGYNESAYIAEMTDTARQLERELADWKVLQASTQALLEQAERDLYAERALADRLAAPLFFNEHEALSGEDLEWTPAHVEAVKAWKEARRA